MSRRFTFVTIGLAAVTAFLIGLVVAGSLSPTRAVSSPGGLVPPVGAAARAPGLAAMAAVVDFADIAEQLNLAVVSIDATARADARSRRFRRAPGSGPLSPPFEGDEMPRRGAGSGFIIDPDGHILTNHHVIDDAERILVRLADGRTARASVVGTDPATDVALIKIDVAGELPAAPLGDSDALRVGEWVCAIGNPLAYEHTVTVGVVSFIGRKLFDRSLDAYIQTDAAINFGNSGGPLINGRGEVVGINSAISSRAPSIGFAVPINQARSILPQLKAHGRVARGYIGVTLTDVRPELDESLRLGAARGALVMDVTANSPGERAGIRPYDVIVAVEGQAIEGNHELIRNIAAREPGSAVRLDLLRDGRPRQVLVKLAERPDASAAAGGDDSGARPSRAEGPAAGPDVGLAVRELTRESARRLGIPGALRGVLVSRVDPASAAADAAMERGFLILEINRQRVGSPADYDRVVSAARAGDILTFYVYKPALEQRDLIAVQLDGR